MLEGEMCFFFQAEDGIRDVAVTGVQTCALPISIAYGKNQFERPKTHSRLTMSTSLRNIGANALSILTSDVMNRATSFVVYAMVARKLGAFEFGQMSLALSLFYIFQIFAVSGVKTLLIREVAKDRSQTRKYFVNGCLIVGVKIGR